MSYMRDGKGKRLDSFQVAGALDLLGLRQRHLPAVVNREPKTAATLPTVTMGAASAATVIAGSVDLRFQTRNYFTISDPRIVPVANNVIASVQGPFWVEWQSDSPLFEIIARSNGGGFRLLADGDIVVPVTALDSSGATRRLLVDWVGVRKTRVYRLECGSNVQVRGIAVLPSDSVSPTPWQPPVVVWGDSFTEPTIQDSVVTTTCGHEGWPFVMGRALGLRNVLASGSGGTGILNPGTGGRVALRDRIDQEIALNPPLWFIAMGINDANREGSTPSYTAQMAHDEMAYLLAHLRTTLPDSLGGVFSPWCSHTPTSSLYAFRDAMAAAATEAGVPFFDVLGLTPASRRVAGTMTAAATTSASSLTSTGLHEIGDVLQVGKPAWGATLGATKLVTVAGRSGTGPYTYALTGTLGSDYPAGTPVVNSGQAWAYGTGRQGAATGNGPADFLIGPDSTHPTVDGHRKAGMDAAQLVRAAVPI